MFRDDGVGGLEVDALYGYSEQKQHVRSDPMLPNENKLRNPSRRDDRTKGVGHKIPASFNALWSIVSLTAAKTRRIYIMDKKGVRHLSVSATTTYITYVICICSLGQTGGVSGGQLCMLPRQSQRTGLTVDRC